MIVPALIFLSLPMLFAIATEAFRGYPLMRSTLMRSFYIQCYYFSPFILVMWSFYSASFTLYRQCEDLLNWLVFGVFRFYATLAHME